MGTIILLAPPTNLQYPFVYQIFISLANMSLESFMALSVAHSSVLTPEILLKISTFITYTPRFKDDIILVQAADWPLDIAPPYLPQSIALLRRKMGGGADFQIRNFLKELSIVRNRVKLEGYIY